MLRHLRIAVSVACGLCCVLVILLWVRSYRKLDGVFWPITNVHAIEVDCLMGRVMFHVIDKTPLSVWAPSKFKHYEMQEGWSKHFTSSVLGFYFQRGPLRVDVPYWFMLLALASMAAVSWPSRIEWRFSVRTLLIATTVVAVLLGLAMYTMRD